MSPIVDFYRETSPDYLGRWLQEIWHWDQKRLEEVHNYIQVLFPNRVVSQFNASAPLLDQETIDAFQRDKHLQNKLAISLDVMLRFYGLEYDPDTERVVQRSDFPARARNWISPYNHNYLRITRILKCLVALGLPERARAFFECLKEIHIAHAADIGPQAPIYWQEAVASLGH